MFTKFKRRTNIVFLDPQSSDNIKLEKGEKLDIILSPKTYWVKKMTLPLSSVREIKKLLPSIFEDSLPSGNYSYYAYKEEDSFILFAYEDKKILDLLASKGINSTDIKSIRFAQSEFRNLEGAVGITETESIYLKDGLLVVVPSVWMSESKDLDISELQLSKHTIKLQQFGHIVDTKSLYKIGAILVALALILIGEIFVTKSKVSALEASKEELFSKYNLQATMFQNRSIYNKYLKIHAKQTKLREAIAIFLTMPLKSTQKITMIEYKNNKLQITVSGVKKGSEKNILSYLNTKELHYQTSFHKNSMKIEVSL